VNCHVTSEQNAPLRTGRNTEDWGLSRPHTAGLCVFSRTVPVTQRHAVDRRHLEADLRFSAAWTSLPEAHGSLVEVLVEAAAFSACGHIMLELACDMQQMRMSDEQLTRPALTAR
jgi:hypothetical protein